MEDYNILTPFKRFTGLLKVYKEEVISIYIYAIFSGIVTLSLPLGIQAIINLISGGQISTSWIVLISFVLVGVALSGIMRIMQLTISENLQQKIFTSAAFEFAYRIPRMKLESVESIYIPELTNRFFDTLTVQKGLSKILMDFSRATLQVIFGLILLSFYHPFFIMFSIVLVLILVLIFRFTVPNGIKTSLVESKYKYKVAHWLEELARSLKMFKLGANEPIILNKTDNLVSGYLTSRKAHFKTLIFQYINLVAFKIFITGGLLIIGGLLVLNQQMNIGQFVAAEIIIILILNSVEKIIMSMETIYDVLTALEKIGNVTDIPLDNDKENHLRLSPEEGITVELNNFSYKFEHSNENILNDINLKIEKGSKICIAGFNGAGKSLLLDVISGFHEKYSGSLSYNDVPLGNIIQSSLHQITTSHFSNEDIFEGTILENITLGNNTISFKKIKKIAEILDLKAFIKEQKEGYNSWIQTEGKGLPKSIRLKIILMRSLICTSKLILFHDSINMLKELDKNRLVTYLTNLEITVIVISNDIKIAEKFDQTIIMKKGEIIAKGIIADLKNENWFSKVFQTK